MDNVGPDTLLGEPSCQPKSVATGLERDGNARDGATIPGRFLAPAA